MQNYIKAYQGETVKIEVEVKDAFGKPADLTGAIVKFGLRKSASEILIKDCIVESTPLKTLVKATLLPSENNLVGRFNYEVRLKLSEEVDTVLQGYIDVEPSLLPEI